MTEQDTRDDAPAPPGDEETSAATEPAAPVLSPGDDPLAAEPDSGGRRSLLSRLNPRRLFRHQTPEYFVREGRDLLDSGSYAQATVAFQKAIELDAGYAPAYRGLGKVFYKKGGRSNLEQALKHYQEAVRHSPRDHELYAITAKIYDALGKRKEATLERKKLVIVRALEGDPANPIANNNMGILYLQQGKVETALAYFRKALETDRNFDIAHRNLAATYYQLAKQEESPDKKGDLVARARSEVQRALEIQVSVPSLLAFARILMMQGEVDEALDACNRADAMDPANKDVYLLKKLALERLGRFEEARNAFESYQVFLQAESTPSAK